MCILNCLWRGELVYIQYVCLSYSNVILECRIYAESRFSRFPSKEIYCCVISRTPLKSILKKRLNFSYANSRCETLYKKGKYPTLNQRRSAFFKLIYLNTCTWNLFCVFYEKSIVLYQFQVSFNYELLYSTFYSTGMLSCGTWYFETNMPERTMTFLTQLDV
jgi:hypothetical protein